MLANIVSNPGFEAPPITGWYNTYGTGATLGAWTIGNGSVDLIHSYWSSKEGQQSIDLNGTGPGTIYQDVQTAPVSYRLRFALSGNPDPADPIKQVRVTFGTDVRVFTFDTTGRSTTDMGWQYFDYAVSPANGTTRLTFESLDSGGAGPAIDDVLIEQVGLNSIYYNNTDFSSYAVSLPDGNVDFDWGPGSRYPTLDPDTFSAEWFGTVEAKATGNHKFFTDADDGVRLWVDNQLILDNWNQVPFSIYAGDVNLNGVGDPNDEAIAQSHLGMTGATWADGDADRNGVVDDLDVHSAHVAMLPAPRTFRVPRTYSRTIWLVAGQRYNIRLEYFENDLRAAVKLGWSLPDQSEAVIPPNLFAFPDTRVDPLAPNLTASYPTSDGILLTLPHPAESYVSVWRSTSASGPYTEVGQTTSGTMLDSSVQPNTNYYYKARIGTAGGRSPFGATIYAATTDAPTYVDFTVGVYDRARNIRPFSDATPRVEWKDNSNQETGYVIERLNGATWGDYATVPANQQYWDDPQQTGNITGPQQYRVRAVFADGSRSVPTKVYTATWPIDTAIRLSAEAASTPLPHVTLTWNGHSGATVYYKKKQDATFSVLGTASGSSFVHNVTPGEVYEYKVQLQGQYAIIAAGVNVADVESHPAGYVAPFENRGAALLVIDETKADALASRLDRFEQDLVGDGWRVIRTLVPRNNDADDSARYGQVQLVKQRIRDIYAANPDLRSAVLIGHIPLALLEIGGPDGHPLGPRRVAADSYYADTAGGDWNDANTDDADHDNLIDCSGIDVSLDGSYNAPSELELEIGRVDLWGMSDPRRQYALADSALTLVGGVNFPAEDVLLARYFDKDHAFRTRQLAPQRRALIQDNWGVQYAGQGVDDWQNLSAVVGAANVYAKPWVDTLLTSPPPGYTDNQTYLFAHLTGPGNRPDWLAGHTVISDQYANHGSSAVFQELFGSYLWEWQAPGSLLRAVIASEGYGLTATWGNNPEWHHHLMAMGEDIGYGVRLTQNDAWSPWPARGSEDVPSPQPAGQYTDFLSSTVHGAIMGDPTLRMDVVAPARNPTVMQAAGGGVNIGWSASIDAAVVGYTVYRSNGGPWERISGSQYVRSNPLTFTDPAGQWGTSKYMIRAIKPEDMGPDGTAKYFNASTGLFVATPAASWVSLDDTTSGTWKGTFGTEGAYVAGDSTAQRPSYVRSVALSGALETTWAGSTTDTRALQRISSQDPTSRVAAAYENSSSLSMTINVNDANTHHLSLYFLDWQRLGRSQTVEILNPTDNSTVLALGSISDFQDGLYIGLEFTGSIRIRITGETPGASAVLSGMFFD